MLITYSSPEPGFITFTRKNNRLIWSQVSTKTKKLNVTAPTSGTRTFRHFVFVTSAVGISPLSH